MIDLECPNCGRMGSVPNDKADSRLVCKKCHRVFHKTPSGRTMLGEPPAPGKGGADGMRKSATATKDQVDWTESLFDQSGGRSKLLLGLLVVGILALGYLLVGTGSKDILVEKAEIAARAMADNQLATIVGLASSDTAVEIPKWNETVQNAVADLKKGSASQKLLPNVFVLEENHSSGTGEVLISLAPEMGSTRDKSIASAAGFNEKAVTQIMTYWVLSRGSWRIDGAKTAPAPLMSTRH